MVLIKNTHSFTNLQIIRILTYPFQIHAYKQKFPLG